MSGTISIAEIKKVVSRFFLNSITFLKKNFSGIISVLAFLACLTVSVYYVQIGLNNTLLDSYGFRQTQTAISSYYMLHEEGKFVDKIFHYQDPVLGKPWSIPMEFPFYQSLVALVTAISGVSMELVGRLVSIILFYLSFVPLFLFLRSLKVDWKRALVFLSLAAINPVFIFWSRTFMIESTAFFFGMGFLAFNAGILNGMQKPSGKIKQVVLSVFAVLSGMLCGLSKSTTFLIFCFATGLLYLYFCFVIDSRSLPLHLKIISYLKRAVPVFGLALLVAIAWIAYSDYVKTLNPLARDFIVSNKLTTWNYGTFKQRLSFFVGGGLVFDKFRLGALFFGLICLITGRKYQVLALGSLLAYLCGPLMFVNLYVEHYYYWYANTVFLVLFVGFSVFSMIERLKGTGRIGGVLLVCLFVLFSTFIYRQEYYPLQFENTPVPEAAKVIRENTEKNDIILIYGNDWSPEIPYYAQRKAIMDRWNMGINDYRFKEAITALADDNVRAMLIPKDFEPEFVNEKIEYFHFTRHISIEDGEFLLYLR
ncbi:MAG: hypothetical protein JW969_18255 [Spirochaetales bacterium]|nr:hypothetical protein [Spirochaetales bacterium]